MRRKSIRLAACTLLSLLLVFGVVAVFRHADKRLPLNPIAAAETITAAENTREASTTAPAQNEETTTSPQDEQMTTRLSADRNTVPNTNETEPVTAFFRGSAAAVGTDVPGGVPQLRPDVSHVGTGFDGEEGSRAVTATTAPVFVAETTTTLPETTTAPVTTASSGGAAQPYRPAVTESSTRPQMTTRPAEPTTAEELTTETEETIPKIQTNLGDYSWMEQLDASDVTLSFWALLKGNTDGYSLRVRLLSDADAGTGIILKPEGVRYSVQLPRGVHHFILTICKDGRPVEGTSEEYTVEIDAKHPVGKEPPIIETSLDDGTREFNSNRYTLYVKACTAKGDPIYADRLTVTLDGEEVRNPTQSGSATYGYELYFNTPYHGEKEEHTVTVFARDGKGNSACKPYTIAYLHVSDGDRTGEVKVILDATTVGLGVLETPKTVDVHQGESVAEIVRQVLDYYAYSYDFGKENGVYLRWIGREGMCEDAQVPDGLWTMIRNDGLETTAPPSRDKLEEFDYTQGAGWMYCINDQIFPGKGMDRVFPKDGDTLRVCFTLSYGKDVGGFDSAGTGMGSLTGYCRIWRDNEFEGIPLAHTWGVPNADGNVECTVCHETHTHTWSAPDEHGEVICTTCHEKRKEGDGA